MQPDRILSYASDGLTAALYRGRYAPPSDRIVIMLGGSDAWLDLRPVVEGQLRMTLEGKQSADAAIGNLARVVTDSKNAG